jgi:Asp-tRNA(Asn)/Glu-tRNA(Gln) amidotransferase A subunit family amidase
VPRKVVVVSDMLAFHRQAGWYPKRSEMYADDTLAFIRKGEELTGADLVLARRQLHGLGEEFMRVFEQVDVLLLPTVIMPAPTINRALGNEAVASHWADSVFSGGRPLVPEVMRATGPVGWCGLASASVPCGFSTEGLPLGLQFVARDETTALSAAARFQEITEFHEARPPVLSSKT